MLPTTTVRRRSFFVKTCRRPSCSWTSSTPTRRARTTRASRYVPRLIQAAENALVNEREAVAEYLRSVTGEEATPRSELLARVGEQDEDEEAEERLEAAEDEEDADDQDLDEKADQLMAHVEEIMRESEANGTDPSDKLREVVGASLMKQIMEGYQR